MQIDRNDLRSMNDQPTRKLDGNRKEGKAKRKDSELKKGINEPTWETRLILRWHRRPRLCKVGE